MMCFSLRATKRALAGVDSTATSPFLDFTWYINSKLHPIVRQRIGEDLSTVSYVQADGDELEWIRENISGIRMNKNRVIKWTGEDARFIVESLPVDWSKK